MLESAQLTEWGWTLLAISAGLAAAGLATSLRGPTDKALRAWASRHGLELTVTNHGLVFAYLRRTRALQIAGAATGWLASPVYSAITGRPFPLGGNWVALGIGGYLVGAVIAEATSQRPSQGPSRIRSATLKVRAPADYIPSRTIWALRALPLLTVACAALYAVVSKDPARSLDEPSVGLMATASVLLVAFAVLVEVVLRAIVARPQPVTAPDLLSADGAIRASSMHALSGAAIAFELLAAGWALVSLGIVTSIGPLNQVLPWVGLLTSVSALLVWPVLGQRKASRVQHAAPVGRAS